MHKLLSGCRLELGVQVISRHTAGSLRKLSERRRDRLGLGDFSKNMNFKNPVVNLLPMCFPTGGQRLRKVQRVPAPRRGVLQGGPPGVPGRQDAGAGRPDLQGHWAADRGGGTRTEGGPHV